MVQRQPLPSDEHDNPRAELDVTLEVSSWWTPGQRRRDAIHEDAPPWWRGEDEATQSFLTGMGLTSVDQLRR